MLKKYKKSDYFKHSLLYVKKPFYKGIYFSILFFIFIGDSILYFFSITIKTIAVAIRKISAIGIDYREELIESGNNAITIAKTRYREMRVCINILIQKLYTVRNLLRWKAPIIELRLPTFPKITLPQLHVPHIGKHVGKRGRGRPRKYAPVRVVTPFKYFLLGIVFAMLFIAVQQGYYFIKSLPNPKLIGSVNYPLSSHLYDRSGKLLYEFYRDQNRTPVRLRELPPYLASATIAIEDKDYYRHNGVALISGIVRAVKENISQGGLQGGSTITQQLVKSALLTPEKTLERKIKEIILALWAERLYTKDQILEMYLNQVAYGGASYGIEEAARTYFGKHAKDMALAEAALLAGLPQAPSLYSPYFNPKAALWRRNDVLRKMFEQGYITAEQKEAAVTIPLAVVPPQTKIKAPHFVFYVRSQLEERYGIKQVEEGGLRVVTTLDLTIQQEAEKILQEELDKIKNLNVTNGGILVTKPSTGEILAMVGSIDYFSSPSGAFNVTTALRQPGSSIKPIMYSLALEKGYTAAS
ncbi:penicillin-binding protein, partial [Candidatus Roizmanbacteria bacterium]|nr:penicillin-binding protein [Candidatus Roizmanbacteria bacterium]